MLKQILCSVWHGAVEVEPDDQTIQQNSATHLPSIKSTVG
jgi:hypothetical protein